MEMWKQERLKPKCENAQTHKNKNIEYSEWIFTSKRCPRSMQHHVVEKKHSIQAALDN